ncbi:hypothetical protein, partial [Chryseobacterium sp. JUb7]|uniref:hypothetical protein n=1 Tax=Chryseobacterium sp. JUb7 TaxID=2940599 RepID=UPI00216714C1
TIKTLTSFLLFSSSPAVIFFFFFFFFFLRGRPPPPPPAPKYIENSECGEQEKASKKIGRRKKDDRGLSYCG